MRTPTIDATVTINGVPRNVEWHRTDEHYTGNVDGTAFRFMLANRQTAIREAEKAARALAAWTAILRDMPDSI